MRSDPSPPDDITPGGVGRPRPTIPIAATPATHPAGSPPPLPDRDHLHRLRDVWLHNPIYFLTCCTAQRRPLLTHPQSAAVLTTAFSNSPRFHHWAVGRHVIMPDHVHFFARPYPDAKPLSDFLRDLKKWTARQLIASASLQAPVWQPEFLDHLLRSPDSYSGKWDYVRLNPVRAGLVADAAAWPYAGECESLSL